jgi:hypothetical protein
MTSGVLVIVSVHARLPIVLHTDGTPEGLELEHEELISEGRMFLALLLLG